MTAYAAALTALQDAILFEDDAALAACIAPGRNPALRGPQRLAVYADGYRERLLQVVAADYPATARLVGDSAFAALAASYVHTTPSRHWDLNLYAVSFAAFLRAALPDDPFAADLAALAALESAVVAVFWQPDSPPFVVDASLTPARLDTLCLRPRQAAQLLQLGHPADTALAAFRRGEQLVRLPAEPVFLYVVRQDNLVQRQRLAAAEHALLARLLAGQPVGAALAATLADVPETPLVTAPDAAPNAATVQGWFARWFAHGFFQHSG